MRVALGGRSLKLGRPLMVMDLLARVDLPTRNACFCSRCRLVGIPLLEPNSITLFGINL